MAKPTFGRHLVFKSGIHTNEGDQVWPADRVRGVLDASKRLSPSRIPYTLLHPSDHLPIFGFADRDSLQLRELPGGEVAIDIMPLTFAEGVIPALKGKGLDKISVGLGVDDQIVHLGLVPKPAVKGLGKVFSEADEASVGSVDVVFASADLDEPVRAAFGSMLRSRIAWIFEDLGTWMQGLRDRTIEAKGLDAADAEVPQYLIENLKRDLPEDDPVGDAAIGSAFSQSTDDAMDEETKKKLARLDALEAENATLKTGLSEAQNRAAELEAGERKRQITVFLDGISDRVPNSMRVAVEGILEDLQALKPRVFSAADGTTTEKSSFDVFKELLSSAKPVVVFGEVATHGAAGTDAGGDSRPISQRADDETREQIERAGKGK